MCDAASNVRSEDDEDALRPETPVPVLSAAGMPPAHAPRPVFHPIRTRAGVTLTDVAPPDHPWHRGVGVAMPQVNASNLWGGGTYRSGIGYVDQDDHGLQDVVASSASDGTVTLTLAWMSHDGHELIREDRTATIVDPDGHRVLQLRSRLRAAHPGVVMGSPGSAGRAGAGYGGWFWRFGPCTEIDIDSAEGSGEARAHQSASPWVSFAATFADGDATVLFRADDTADRWFVRAREYPAVGRSLAAERPFTLTRDGIDRTLTCVIADGRVPAQTMLATLSDPRRRRRGVDVPN